MSVERRTYLLHSCLNKRRGQHSAACVVLVLIDASLHWANVSEKSMQLVLGVGWIF